MLHWTNHLRVLLRQSAYFTGKPETTLTIHPQRTLLWADIVAPTIDNLGWELTEKRLARHAIHCDDFRAIPALYVDRDMFQQVFFNLLDNAIKYAQPDPKLFRIDIVTSDEGDVFRIRIRDNGIGLPANMDDDNLFRLGARGPDTFRYGDGSGIGLWIVRVLLELHNARITIKQRNPTEFQIDLPRSLAKRRELT